MKVFRILPLILFVLGTHEASAQTRPVVKRRGPAAASSTTTPIAKPAVRPTPAPAAAATTAPAVTTPMPPVNLNRAIQRSLISMDYNSWFERLTITNTAGGLQESQALLYGFGLNYESNFYYPDWGWGLGIGALGGSATGGDKSGPLTYFQARVPWWAARVSPRLFYRWNPQLDFGVDLAAMYKNINWPDATGSQTATSGSKMVTGIFLDARLRVNARLEMVQSFGMLYKDESIYWRLGLGYRL